jgi:hypothetical protein
MIAKKNVAVNINEVLSNINKFNIFINMQFIQERKVISNIRKLNFRYLPN